jgi:putative tricarboxylic transport membrane protein
VLYPATIALSCAGIYALDHSTIDLYIAAAFGIAGYLLRSRGFEAGPMLLGFVLSQPIRDNFNRALVFSNGDLTTFVTHPLSAVLLTVAGTALLITALPVVRRGRAHLIPDKP